MKRRRQSKLSGSQSPFWTGRGLGLFILAGEGEHAFIMKLLPIDLACLEELAHLFTGPMKPCLKGAQWRRYSQVEECRRMAVLAGRSLKGLYLLQVPFGHDLGEEPVGLAHPCLSGLCPVGLGVHGCHARMLAQFGRPYPFEAEQVKPDGCSAQFAVQGLNDLQNALWAVEMPSAHRADANDWKSGEVRHALEAADIIFRHPALQYLHQAVEDSSLSGAADAGPIEVHGTGNPVHDQITVPGNLRLHAEVLYRC
jgi:hypothetical protein